MATGTLARPDLREQASALVDLTAGVLRRHAGLVITAVMALGSAWYMSGRMLERHATFHSNAFDLGYFDQIAFNTSQGRFFESSFITFNFLGQHFEPVLLVFALMYRLGAGVESLLVSAALMASLAAVPLYIAARRFSDSDLVGVFCSGAFLLSAPLHEGLNFDFHPETLAFVFAFTAMAFLAYGRAWQAVAAAFPLLLLKEDMALIAGALAVLIALRGHIRPAITLGGVAAVWLVATSLILMPAIRGEAQSDLTNRYAYLTQGTTTLNVAPVAASRALANVGSDTAEGLGRLLLSSGGVAVLNPAGFAMAAGLASLTGAANHSEQAALRLHYAVPTLMLLWAATLLSLATLRRWHRRLPVLASGVIALCAALSFFTSSPFAPGRGYSLPSGDIVALDQALALIPSGVPVEAQSTILPHVSRRHDVYEFPDDRRGEYVVLASGLGRSRQGIANGFATQYEALSSEGYTRIYASHGVEVWRSLR